MATEPEKTRATLIGLLPLSETSLIVRWCSPEMGLFKTVARGARKPKSPFAGRLDLFFETEVVFQRSRRADLHHLREVRVREARYGLRSRYVRTVAAAYFVRLIGRVAEPETPVEKLHDLLVRALDYLDHSDPDERVVLFFERELARLSGFGPGEGRDEDEVLGRLEDHLGLIPEGRGRLMRMLRGPGGEEAGAER